MALIGTINASNDFGLKNRIINGAMVIDQRNAGAAVTINNTGAIQYSVDRLYGYGQSTDGVFTLQQDSDVPSGQGFRNSLKAVVTTADASIGATQLYQIGQRIEGFNVADLGLGTASASTMTLSFWVRSSLTGTFGGSFMNGGQNRSYPYSYTISAANTWEKKTITLTGDTSGTWLTTNGTGLEVIWGLGVGSTYLSTANAWAGSYLSGVTGQTQVIATSGATLYITGVQLEKGSTATSFDYRPYSTELALCQRYYEKSYNIDVAAGASTVVGYASLISNSGVAGQLWGSTVPFKVTKRATPTISTWSYTGVSGQWHWGSAGASESIANVLTYQIGMNNFQPYFSTGVSASQNTMYGHWAAVIEL
jgi:hypothetical protein